MSEIESIPLDQCEHGYLYRIRSRNLMTGVFNKESNGFIGIREKFGNEYLFTEYHWDTGAPFGTVHPVEKLAKVPDDIEIKESLGSFDEVTDRRVAFDKPVAGGGKGWYFVDTGEASQDISAIHRGNRKLEDWIRSQSITEQS